VAARVVEEVPHGPAEEGRASGDRHGGIERLPEGDAPVSGKRRPAVDHRLHLPDRLEADLRARVRPTHLLEDLHHHPLEIARVLGHRADLAGGGASTVHLVLRELGRPPEEGGHTGEVVEQLAGHPPELGQPLDVLAVHIPPRPVHRTTLW
jgi:hypothetical protein